MTTATPCNDAVVKRFRWWKWIVPLLLGGLLLTLPWFEDRLALEEIRANAGNEIVMPDVVAFEPSDLGGAAETVGALSIKQPNMGVAGMAALSGVCDTGRTHNLEIDGEVVDTFDCPDGTWSWNGDLAAGDHSINLHGLLADGTIGKTAAIGLPLAAAAVAATTFDLPSTGEYAPGSYALSGTTAANGDVNIIVNGSKFDTVTADADGNWSYDLALDEEGEYTVAAYALNDRAQAVAGSGSQTLIIAGETVAEAEPEEEAEEEPAAEEETAAEPNFELNIIGQNEDASGNAANGFYGTGPSGITLEILEGDRVVGGAIVLADGTWRCGCQLAPGEHTLYVRDADNTDLVSNEITLVVENPAPAYEQPTGAVNPDTPKFSCADVTIPPSGEIIGTLWKVAPCETLGWIATRAGTTVAELIAYNPQISSPSQIYAGQLLNIPLNAGCFDVNQHSSTDG